MSEIAGTFWNIPNDIFNGRQRKLLFQNGARFFRGGDYANTPETIAVGNYVNVDDKMGIASKLPLTLVRKGYRQVEIKWREHSGTLYTEEICAPYSKEYKWVDRGSVLIDTGFALALGDAEHTGKLSESLFSCDTERFKTVGVTAKDGKVYVLAYNYTEEACDLHTADFCPGTAYDVVNKKKVQHIEVKAGKAVLLSFDQNESCQEFRSVI